MTVDFATYCCDKDRDKLYDNHGHHYQSHNYPFDNSFIVFQRTAPFDEEFMNGHIPLPIRRSDYPLILQENSIDPYNSEADDYTHGWKAAHYWMHHCVNQLEALNESEADYIVLADADCYIKNQRSSWVTEGIKILQENESILVVSPSDGTQIAHQTQNMSQQVMLVDRKRLLGINFDLPFEGFRDGGPMQEYYFMLEGRIGRYMEKNNLYRYMLSSDFRYWHNQW
jgi:hypothetical protein